MGRRSTLSHDHRRLALHYLGHLDPTSVMLVNSMIGMVGLPWADVLGNPNAVLHQASFYTAKILSFPERRSELTKLRAEVEEIRAFVRTTLTAKARAGAVGAVGT